MNSLDNVDFICGDVANSLHDVMSEEYSVIFDPPRKGLPLSIIQFMLKIRPPYIAYLSCNSATMARDLGLLSNSYLIEKVVPIDFFPQTTHLECLALLKLESDLNS